jgi:enoyl-CoA hydratase/carnithine racemase
MAERRFAVYAVGMSDHIHVESDGAVRVIRLDRAEKKNAFTQAMYLALVRALREADADAAVNVVLLHGAGDAFTAGNDLRDFLERPGTVEDAGAIQLLLQLVRQEKPVMAAVHGAAVGIGTTMLLHLDYVAAASNARFQLPFVNLGLCAEGASSVVLPRLLGLARASEWLMFGEPFDARAALEGGLLNAVVDPAELETFARARAQALAQKPFGAVLATKRLLRGPLRAEHEATLRREGALFFERLQSPEAKAAFNAFLTRKK